jgi:hypothetical protein
VTTLIEEIATAASDLRAEDVTDDGVRSLADAFEATITHANEAIKATYSWPKADDRTPSPPPPPFTGTEGRTVQGTPLDGLTRPTQAEPDPVPVPLRPDLWRALGKAQRALAEPLS